MMRAVLLVVCVLAFAVAAMADVEVPFTDCGSSADAGKVNRITANKFPPAVGDHLSMHQFHNSVGVITSGTYKIVTKFSGITVDTKTGDLCAYGNFKCHNAAGAIQIDLESDVGSVPAGSYTMETSATDQNGKTVFCHRTAMKF